ncbi:MAG: carbohydrate kinase family protein [Anaerolineales bacterium]|jgi:adenosine kinase
MDIVITGSVAYDYLMTFPGKFKDHILIDKLEAISLSFLVNSLVRRRGGIAPNIAYNLALLGGHPKIFATVGTDFVEYRAWLEEQGVDTTYAKVIDGEMTASFFATTDQENAQLASFYSGAMAHSPLLSLYDLKTKPDLVLVSPTEPEAMDRYIAEAKEMGIDYMYDPSQQIVYFDGDTLRRGMDGAKAMFVNEYEFELVRRKTGLSEREVLSEMDFLVVTLGEKGVAVYQGNDVITVKAVPPQRIMDPTGAGDAFRGGFLTGYRLGWDFHTCAQMGALSATYCLENDGPQGQSYTIEDYVQRYRQNYEDDQLDDLLNH